MCFRLVLQYSCLCQNSKAQVLFCVLHDGDLVDLQILDEDKIKKSKRNCFGDSWDEPAKIRLKRPCFDCIKSDLLIVDQRSTIDIRPVYERLGEIAHREHTTIIELISDFTDTDTTDRLSPEDLKWIRSLILSLRYNIAFLETKDQAGIKRRLEEKGYSPVKPITKSQVESLSLLEAQLDLIDISNIIDVALRGSFIDSEAPLPPLFEQVPWSDDSKDDNECPICSSTYGEQEENGAAEEPVKSPCNHIIGSRCFKEWVVQQGRKNCPLCRTGFSETTHDFPLRTPEWLTLLRGF